VKKQLSETLSAVNHNCQSAHRRHFRSLHNVASSNTD